ncbi:MAG: hypothetical protein ACTSR8_19280 [Promethearchaeota archaeon]
MNRDKMPPTKTAQNAKVKAVKEITLCNKCGSVMIMRKITERNGSKNGTAKLVTILQCIVCRHWKKVP